MRNGNTGSCFRLSYEKPVVILIFVFLHEVSFGLPLWLFFITGFQQSVVYFCVIFLVFILFWIYWFSWICKFIVVMKSEKVLPVISSLNLCVPPYTSFIELHPPNTGDHLMFSTYYRGFVYISYILFFFLCSGFVGFCCIVFKITDLP